MVPIRYEAGWAPELVWMPRLEEKSFASARDQTPVIQPVDIILTELPGLIMEDIKDDKRSDYSTA
jgi:hypothetical protein